MKRFNKITGIVDTGLITSTVITGGISIDSAANITSQAMQDGDISPTEFDKVLQEVEKYCQLKADIRNQAKAKIKQITNEKREELLEQGRKEDKEDFFRKIANTSGTQGVNVI